MRRLIALRRKHPGLGARGSVEVRHEGYPLVYTRAGRYLVVINPRREPAVLPLDGLLDGVGASGWADRVGRAGRAGGVAGVTPLEVQGVRIEAAGELRADGFSYGVFDLG